MLEKMPLNPTANSSALGSSGWRKITFTRTGSTEPRRHIGRQRLTGGSPPQPIRQPNRHALRASDLAQLAPTEPPPSARRFLSGSAIAPGRSDARRSKARGDGKDDAHRIARSWSPSLGATVNIRALFPP